MAITTASATDIFGASGSFMFCAELGHRTAPVTDYGCVLRNGKGSIAFADGRTLWLRNVHSYDVSAGAVSWRVLTIKGDVVEAADAATAATMTPHHSFYLEFTPSVGDTCYGYAYNTWRSDYRILEKTAVEELLEP